jgi:hypothetical protein
MQRRLAPALAGWKTLGAAAPPLRIQDHAKTVRTLLGWLLVLLYTPHRTA